MESITLGQTGLSVSRLGMGCWAIGGHGWGKVNDDDSVLAVREAFNQDVNFFDTADAYGFGHSENIIRRALGKERKRVVIASKFGVRWDSAGRTWRDNSPAYMNRALEASLRRLGLDTLPLYYVHWPDGITPISDVIGEMDRMREQGKIKAIGISNFTPDQLNEALECASIDAVQIQFSLIAQAQARLIIPICQEHSISLVSWGSLADGLLTGKFNAKTRFGPDDHRSHNKNFQGRLFSHQLKVVDKLSSVAAQLGVGLPQLVLRWLLDTAGVSTVLFGAKTDDQVNDNLGAMGISLSSKDYREICQVAEEFQE